MLRENDGRHVVKGAASSSIRPKGEANPDRRSRERESAHALQYLGTADDKGTKKDGTRSTRPKRVRSVPKSRVETREQRRALRNNALDQGNRRNDVMESKFEEFNLLIKENDDTEPLRTHLQLNSQSCTTFLEMRQAINQYLKERKGFELKEREDDLLDKGKEKQNDKGKFKSK